MSYHNSRLDAIVAIQKDIEAGHLSRRQLLKRAAFLGLSMPLVMQLLAACGDSPTPTASSASTAATGATTAAGTTAVAGTTAAAAANAVPITKKVRLTYGSGGGITLFARTRGVFEPALAQQGIGVEWVGPFPNHAPSMQAVVGGSADFSFGGSTTPALAAIIAGNPLVFVSLIISNPKTTAILVKSTSGIKTVKDLVGKKVAVNRSGLGEFLLLAALEKNGVGFDKVERVYLNPPDADPAFGTDKVDAWAIWSGPRELAEVNYGAVPIFTDGGDLKPSEQVDTSSFLVLDDYAKNNVDVIKAVLAAYQVEADWSSKNTKDANDLSAKVNKYTQAVADKIGAYKTQTFLTKPDDKASFDLQYAADWLAARGVIPSKITVADHFAKL